MNKLILYKEKNLNYQGNNYVLSIWKRNMKKNAVFNLQVLKTLATKIENYPEKYFQAASYQ